MDSIIGKIMSREKVAMSQGQIQSFMRSKGVTANIKTEIDIAKMKSFGELFGSSDHVIIFVSIESAASGHWEMMFLENGCIYWFDSYGFGPSYVLNSVFQQYGMNAYGESFNLPALIQQTQQFQSGKSFMNIVKYQQQADNIETCGRHCCTCLFFRQIARKKGQAFDLNLYYTMMQSYLSSMPFTKDYDGLVSYIVS